MKKEMNSKPLPEMQSSNTRQPRTLPLVDCFFGLALLRVVSFSSATSQNSLVTQLKRQRSLEQNLTAQGEVLPSEGSSGSPRLLSFVWKTSTDSTRASRDAQKLTPHKQNLAS